MTTRRPLKTHQQRRAPAPPQPPAPPAPGDIVGPGVEVLTGAQDDEEEDALSQLLTELAGSNEAKVTVHRIVGPGQKMRYVFECPPAEFAMARLRDEFDGGDFRIFITRGRSMLLNKAVSVEEPKRAPAAPPEVAAMNVDVAKLMLAIERQGEVIQRIDRERAAPASPLAGMNLAETLTALGTVVSAFRSLIPAPVAAPASSGGKEAVDLLLRGLDLGRELSDGKGEGDSGGGLMGILAEAVKPMIAQAVANAASHPVRAEPVRIAAPAAASSSAPPPPPAPPAPAGEPTMTNANPILSHYLGLLCKKADEGADPALYADVVLDNVPTVSVEAMLAAEPDAVSALAQVHAGVELRRAWFEQLTAAIRTGLDAINAEGGGRALDDS
jgi:hypothetical protein